MTRPQTQQPTEWGRRSGGTAALNAFEKNTDLRFSPGASGSAHTQEHLRHSDPPVSKSLRQDVSSESIDSDRALKSEGHSVWLSAECRIGFQTGNYPTPFIFMLRPRSNPLQYVSKSVYSLNPNVPVDEHEDARGNLVQRVIAPPATEFSVVSSADVLVHSQPNSNECVPFTLVQYLPPYVLEYLLPSRYCESDRFGSLATDLTSGLAPGYQQVDAICRWVSTNVQYLPGTSNYPVSASEVQIRGSGVCRDLAHLAIALCRGLSIPARMVAGFLLGLEPMDLHTWIEVYLGGAWYRFDPVQSSPSDSRIVLGYGRDAADVAVFNQFGVTVVPATMEVSVSPMFSTPADVGG